MVVLLNILRCFASRVTRGGADKGMRDCVLARQFAFSQLAAGSLCLNPGVSCFVLCIFLCCAVCLLHSSHFDQILPSGIGSTARVSVPTIDVIVDIQYAYYPLLASAYCCSLR